MKAPSIFASFRFSRRIRALAVGAMTMAAFSAFAQAGGPSDQDNLLEKLRRTGKPETRAYLGAGKAEIALAPSGSDADYLGAELLRQNPDVCVESLSLAPLPPEFSRLSRAQRRIALGNVMRSISALKGIEYYSASRGKRRVLFEEAYCVASRSSAQRAPDPLRADIPAWEEAFAFMKDSTFGANAMRLEYRGGPDSLSLSVENLSAMKIGLITAMKPGCFEIILVAEESNDEVVLYALALAKAQALPGMRDKIRESTSNRVDALLEWIRNGLSAPPSAPR
jgi:hypothetical protein